MMTEVSHVKTVSRPPQEGRPSNPGLGASRHLTLETVFAGGGAFWGPGRPQDADQGTVHLVSRSAASHQAECGT